MGKMGIRAPMAVDAVTNISVMTKSKFKMYLHLKNEVAK